MYPQEVDKFTSKLNKLDNNIYVIEEKVNIVNGVYEGELEHDNISLPSLAVYTGTKLTGDKAQNYIVSTPSQTPWKKVIKIFSSVSPVYITYQTQGDTVEADDINKVQDSIVSTQTEVDRYKDANDVRVSNDENRLTIVEINKAEKTYVDTELNKRYLKTETYNKTETDQRIQNVVAAAPAALDTLKELADALGDDANFAGTMTTKLAGKVDKISGKQLSTEDYTTTEKSKLAGIEANANNYIHPTTHPATIIVTDSMHKFVTDEDINLWNSDNVIAAGDYINYKASSIIQISANDLGYIKIFKKVTVFKGSVRLKFDLWDSGNSISHAKIYVNDNNLQEYFTTLLKSVSIDINVQENDILEIGIYSEGGTCNIKNITLCSNKNIPLYGNFSCSLGDYALTVAGVTLGGVKNGGNVVVDNSGNMNVNIPTKLSQLSNDSNFVTQSQLGNTGYGDMLKSIYDTNNSGVVDNAENLGGHPASYFQPAGNYAAASHNHTKSQITDFPSSLPANGGTAASLSVSDNRITTINPQDRNIGVYFDFIANSTDSLSDGGTYHGILTFRQYGSGTDWTGGTTKQIGFTDNGNLWIRQSTGNTTWSSWNKILIKKAGGLTWNDLKGV
jgi:hypothetical protein